MEVTNSSVLVDASSELQDVPSGILPQNKNSAATSTALAGKAIRKPTKATTRAVLQPSIQVGPSLSLLRSRSTRVKLIHECLVSCNSSSSLLHCSRSSLEVKDLSMSSFWTAAVTGKPVVTTGGPAEILAPQHPSKDIAASHQNRVICTMY